MICREISSWVSQATADNSAATATKSASGKNSHFITGVAGSFSAAAIKTLILKEGSTELARFHVHNNFSMTFASPIKLQPGTVANLVLAASGTGGVDGTAVLIGYTS